MLPLPARSLVLLTLHWTWTTCAPLGAVVPVQCLKTNGNKGAKAASAVATQNFIWDSKFEQGEPSWWASSCCLCVCGLVYSETHALVAMSSGRLSVSSPVCWPWGQLAFNELHPGYWTLKDRVAVPDSQWGAVPLVVPRIWGLLGGELACLGQVCARSSWTVGQWQQFSASAWE